jgi:hypothetical protein
LAGACGGQSTLSERDDEPAAGEAGETGNGGASNGGTSSGGVSGGGFEPCAGKECGAPCSVCPPDAPCDPIAMFCDSRGTCTTALPQCSRDCLSANDCPAFEGTCLSCPGDSIVCPQMECVRGSCLPGSVACPECQEDSECPVPPLQCGTCADGTASCPMPVCYQGQCTVGWSGGCVGSLPCAELVCGASCNPCTRPECPPLEVPHFCNRQGECATEPGCGRECTAATDCPPPPPSCGDCPIDTCLATACVNGACEFVCR